MKLKMPENTNGYKYSMTPFMKTDFSLAQCSLYLSWGFCVSAQTQWDVWFPRIQGIRGSIESPCWTVLEDKARHISSAMWEVPAWWSVLNLEFVWWNHLHKWVNVSFGRSRAVSVQAPLPYPRQAQRGGGCEASCIYPVLGPGPNLEQVSCPCLSASWGVKIGSYMNDMWCVQHSTDWHHGCWMNGCVNKRNYKSSLQVALERWNKMLSFVSTKVYHQTVIMV